MAQAKKMLSRLKRFQEGGEVTDEFPEEAGAMPDQNPSEAAKRLLYYKKTAAPSLPPGVVPDTGQADGIYQEPSVASETSRVFGMQPREDRLSILPRYSRETGLVAPEMLYDAARAFTAPSVAARGYEVAPEDAVNMAVNFTGAGLGTSAAMRKPMGEGGVDLAMNAYHGSPYDIPGKFDISKVGTGTGAQQYGHGVYFAEARPTAERFKKGAKQKGFDFQAEEKALGIELPTNARSHFMILSQQMPDNPALSPIDAAELVLSKNPEARNISKEKLANLFQTYQEKTQGNLYQVDIPDAQVAKMLDWNKPLSQQSPEVLDVLKKLPAIQEDLRAGKTLDDLKGMNAYQAIASSFNVKQNEAYKLASDFLNAQGIPGVRYDDYYAPGQSNFVVFDPSMVKMLMRNDKPVSTLPSSTTAKEDLAKIPNGEKKQSTLGTEDFNKLVSKTSALENEPISSIREQWIGGVSGVGDRSAAYDLLYVPKGREYQKETQNIIRQEIGNNFKGYRLMHKEELEELISGSMGSDLASFSLDKKTAEKFANLAAYRKTNKDDLVVVEMDLTPEHVWMLGKPGEKELVVNYGVGYNPENLKITKLTDETTRN